MDTKLLSEQQSQNDDVFKSNDDVFNSTIHVPHGEWQLHLLRVIISHPPHMVGIFWRCMVYTRYIYIYTLSTPLVKKLHHWFTNISNDA